MKTPIFFLFITIITFTNCSDELIPEPDRDLRITGEIENIMLNQQQCWNNGDLQCFMESYWKSDSLMFIGKSGITYGWQSTLDNYIKGYPDKTAMGQLKFKNIKITPISDSYCYVIGKWHLSRTIGDLEGHYTLMWIKNKEGKWMIISDHSS